jgi:hypothetical protein
MRVTETICLIWATGKTMKLLENTLIESAILTPAEVERAGGPTPGTQRLWRKRGHLKAGAEGKMNGYTLHDAATMCLLRSASEIGFGPNEVGSRLASVAPAVVYFGLLSGDRTCEFSGSPNWVSIALHEFADDVGLAMKLSGASTAPRYLISTDGSFPRPESSLEGLLEDEKFAHFSCMDLLVMGRKIAECLKRPLLRVTQTSSNPRETAHRWPSGTSGLRLVSDRNSED